MATNKDNLYSIFEASAHNFGTKNCIISAGNSICRSLTYTEVVHEVLRLSDTVTFPRHLFVGILGYEVSTEIILCILSILKSDAAFVFLNAAEPEIAASSVEKLQIRHVIGESNLVRKFLTRQWTVAFKMAKTARILDDEFAVWDRVMDCIPGESEMHFAFAALSSGSTKCTPKVIKVPHRSIVPNILDLKKIYQLKPTDTVFVSTPLTFDPCIHDIFLAFSGGCCVLIADTPAKHQWQLVQKLFSAEGYNATVLFTTPSILPKWRLSQIRPCSLRILILGGEPFPSVELLHDLFSRGIQIFNIYGTTEVSCWASIFQVPPNFEGPVPLGSVLSDTMFQLRDAEGRLIDDGVGELFIGSTSRICMVDDGSETKEEICSPCFRGSGDIVKVSKGIYYFVGRKDRRVKLLGHQVDFAEIESRILAHPSVKNCFVFAADVEIVALVELNSTGAADFTAETLKEFISSNLPSHMQPNDIRFVLELPLGSHGKVSSARCKELYGRMRQEVQLEFQNLWTKYTRQPLDMDSGFLDSGGNSFAAVQLSAALEGITKVPRNFMEFLISNKKFSECLGLISGNKIDATSIIANTSPESFRETRINVDVDAIESDRKLAGVLYKGGCLNFGATPAIDKVEVKWRHNLEKCVDASPTLLVFNDCLLAVCGSHSGYLVIVEVDTGSIVAKIKLPNRIESSACACTTGRRIFIGCYDGNMYAIDMITASIIWKFSTNDIIKSTAVIFDKKLFFGSYDHHFYCISSADGTLVWKVNIDNSAIYATAIVRSDVIVSTTLGGTVAFIDHSGAIKKKIMDLKPIFSNPTEIPGQDVVVVVDVSGSMRCFDLIPQSELWRDTVDGCIFSALSTSQGADKIFFTSQNGNIYCFEVSRLIRRELWHHKVGDQTYATPFCCETWNAIIAVSTDGDMRILDAGCGRVLASYSIKAPVFSSPVAYNRHIVVGSRDNFLYCLAVS